MAARRAAEHCEHLGVNLDQRADALGLEQEQQP
jgi:hypothetical protein